MIDAPFPWQGGKSRVADVVWDAFGAVANYVEPFAGSLAVLLGAPEAKRIETVNDLDGFVANFWRATSRDPDAVAAAADWPVNECDLHARHAWLVGERATLTDRLMGDPDFFDAKIAGWWVWGICQWIGTGWCSGQGPWQSVDGKLVNVSGNAGMGINRQLPHLGDAGMGINRKFPHLGNAGRGELLRAYFHALQERLREVRVCCGDWRRVLGPTPTVKLGTTAIFLDPPYDGYEHNYSTQTSVSADVTAWAVEHGSDPDLRIVLCGYEGERDMPSGWRCVAWKAKGGYGSQGQGEGRANARRERLWLSPHCVGTGAAQGRLAI